MFISGVIIKEKDQKKDRLFYTDKQVIELEPFSINGKILDIGGGGEGVIGQLFGEKVISVDLDEEELEEAPSKNLKIVMDAKNLGFIDESFAATAAFFTFMYIDRNEREQIFEEVYRTLKPGGRFDIWDVEIPKYDGGEKDVFVVPVTIKLPEKVIDTGYGIPWENKEQNFKYYLEKGKKVGLELENKSKYGKSFHIVYRKPRNGV